MIKESERIRGKMLVLVGIGYLLLGFVLILSTARITGLVVVGNAPEGLGYALSIVFIVVGILVIMSGRTKEHVGLETTLEGFVFVSEGRDKGEYYMKDPLKHFSKEGVKVVSLRDFRREIGYYRKNEGEEIVDMAKRDYGPILHGVIESGSEIERKVAISFLHVLEPNFKYEEKREELYRVPQEDKNRIISLFDGWRGERLTPRQREILRDYNLVFVKGSNGNKIYYAGTESFISVASTPSHDMQNITATKIVRMIENYRNRDILKKEEEERKAKKEEEKRKN